MAFNVYQGAAENVANPIGVYRNPKTKTEVGCLDPAQADAAVQAGFQLIKQYTYEEMMELSREQQAAVANPAPEATEAPAPVAPRPAPVAAKENE